MLYKHTNTFYVKKVDGIEYFRVDRQQIEQLNDPIKLYLYFVTLQEEAMFFDSQSHKLKCYLNLPNGILTDGQTSFLKISKNNKSIIRSLLWVILNRLGSMSNSQDYAKSAIATFLLLNIYYLKISVVNKMIAHEKDKCIKDIKEVCNNYRLDNLTKKNYEIRRSRYSNDYIARQVAGKRELDQELAIYLEKAKTFSDKNFYFAITVGRNKYNLAHITGYVNSFMLLDTSIEELRVFMRTLLDMRLEKEVLLARSRKLESRGLRLSVEQHRFQEEVKQHLNQILILLDIVVEEVTYHVNQNENKLEETQKLVSFYYLYLEALKKIIKHEREHFGFHSNYSLLGVFLKERNNIVSIINKLEDDIRKYKNIQYVSSEQQFKQKQKRTISILKDFIIKHHGEECLKALET